MQLIKQILLLVKLEISLELRSKAALSALILYVIATVFTVYMCLKTNDDRTWNALVWIVILFVCMNVVSKSFFQTHQSRWNYYYTTVPPVALLFSKIIYNTMLAVCLSLMTWTVFYMLFGIEVTRFLMFLSIIIIGSATLTATLTMLSAIAAKSNNNSTLLAVLSFPILVPIIMLISQLSLAAFTDMKWNNLANDAFSLLAMHVLVYALGALLFPYLWRD